MTKSPAVEACLTAAWCALMLGFDSLYDPDYRAWLLAAVGAVAIVHGVASCSAPGTRGAVVSRVLRIVFQAAILGAVIAAAAYFVAHGSTEAGVGFIDAAAPALIVFFVNFMCARGAVRLLAVQHRGGEALLVWSK